MSIRSTRSYKSPTMSAKITFEIAGQEMSSWGEWHTREDRWIWHSHEILEFMLYPEEPPMDIRVRIWSTRTKKWPNLWKKKRQMCHKLLFEAKALLDECLTDRHSCLRLPISREGVKMGMLLSELSFTQQELTKGEN